MGSDSAAILARSFQHCRAVTRAASTSFYYAMRLTPEPRRSAVFAVYAWMRRADDLADGAGSAAAGVESFRRASVAALETAGAPDAELLWPAFIHVVREFKIEHAWLWSLLDGVGEDLEHRGYETVADLERYCSRVASTVGLICTRIWGLREGADAEGAARLACARGVAFQLTNILRDVAADMALSPPRVYVPREVLGACGLTGAELAGWTKPEACARCVRVLSEHAARRYGESAGLEAMIDASCVPTLEAMTGVYRRLLWQIEREPRLAVRTPPVRVGTARKVLIAARAWLGGVLRTGGGGVRISAAAPRSVETGPLS